MTNMTAKFATILAIGVSLLSVPTASNAAARFTDPISAECQRQMKGGGMQTGDFEATFLAFCYGREHGMQEHARMHELMTGKPHENMEKTEGTTKSQN